tara:strand:- start:124 stop:315 length:192 start_codon:yes stop_codon:yes gene_type:complete
MARSPDYYFVTVSYLMRISLLVVTLLSIVGCEDTDENDEPRETRGALMERIGTEKEKEKEAAK